MKVAFRRNGKFLSIPDALLTADVAGPSETLDVVLMDGAAPTPSPAVPPVVAPPPSGTDAIDLAQAVVASVDCPDVRGWPIVTPLRRLSLSEVVNEQLAIDFDGKASWPAVTPSGWTGGINYTVWMGCFINGAWYVVPIKEALNTYLTVGPILTRGQIPDNLTYFAPPPLEDYQPVAGETLVFFVTTGDTRRMNLQPAGGPGRSNVVAVPFQAGTWTW